LRRLRNFKYGLDYGRSIRKAIIRGSRLRMGMMLCVGLRRSGRAELGVGFALLAFFNQRRETLNVEEFGCTDRRLGIGNGWSGLFETRG
jgi:hypothetical protein